FGPSYRLLLIGGGQLSEYVATIALFNGFDVTVCDPRSEHIQGWSVAGARVVTGMPDDEVIACVPDRRTAIVALTHDPKLDDMALLEALKSSAFYVGAIGSRRNNQSRRERLAEYFDLTAEEIGKLKGPIGLYIGSKTPAEIAVSIMAEIIAIKNGVDVPRELS
ncbi:XdhC family protein, partial [Alcaligenes pakistanensis]